MEKTRLCFFDDYWIDFRTGTVRRWFEPERIGDYFDPLLGCASGANAFYDKEIGAYRVVYHASLDGTDENTVLAMQITKDFKTFTPADIRPDAPEGRRHVIADGKDGVRLECAVLDRAEKDEAKRYKATGLYFPEGIKDYAKICMVSAYSPDLLHWTVNTDTPIHPTTSDADNNILYNPVTDEYMLFFRAGYVDRRICCKRSKDLVHWTEAEVTVHPGAAYNSEAEEIQLYGMVVTYIDGIFYALMEVYHTSLTDMDFTKMFGYVEPELYYSYDGYHYMPTSGRPLVQRPAAPAFGWTQTYLMHINESADGRYYIISGSGAKVVHGTQESNIELTKQLGSPAFGSVFYRIRKDGFCGIDGIGMESKVITKCFQLLDPEITLNVNAAAGSVRCGLMRKNGTFYEGFSFEDSDALRFGDELAFPLTWHGKDASPLVGEQIRVAIELNGATLHAMDITARPWIRRPQASFADPKQLLD